MFVLQATDSRHSSPNKGLNTTAGPYFMLFSKDSLNITSQSFALFSNLDMTKIYAYSYISDIFIYHISLNSEQYNSALFDIKT